MKTYGILGGGIAGLSLSYFLGPDCEVLEKESECGGLCRSYTSGGFTFDLGGHIIFSKDQEILKLELDLLDDNVSQLYRAASIWFKERHIKYPFENGLAALDKADNFDCLINFINNPTRPQNNFEDWIYNTFGKGIAEQYMMPYNRKIWKMEPALMSTDWVERIPKPPAEDIVKSALGIETEGYVHQLHFWYPKTGGFQSLPKSFEKQVSERVYSDCHVTRITHSKNNFSVHLKNGEQRTYKQLINTMPIFDFISCLESVPAAVTKALESLKFNALIVVLVGFKSRAKPTKVATYFPEAETIFHRIVHYDYFGEAYAPEGCGSIVAEITSRYGAHPWTLSDEEVVTQTIQALVRNRFLEAEDVVHTVVKRVKYAYPLYDLERRKNLDVISSWLAEQNIYSCGRFAEFDYVNSDAVIRSAKDLAQRLLARSTKSTPLPESP